MRAKNEWGLAFPTQMFSFFRVSGRLEQASLIVVVVVDCRSDIGCRSLSLVVIGQFNYTRFG